MTGRSTGERAPGPAAPDSEAGMQWQFHTADVYPLVKRAIVLATPDSDREIRLALMCRGDLVFLTCDVAGPERFHPTHLLYAVAIDNAGRDGDVASLHADRLADLVINDGRDGPSLIQQILTYEHTGRNCLTVRLYPDLTITGETSW